MHRETRGTIDYEVTLGPAHVTNLNWLLQAMFRELVPVEDPTKVASIQPPLAFVLEPKFEEYSFLTPKDVAGEAFVACDTVTVALTRTACGLGTELALLLPLLGALRARARRACRGTLEALSGAS